MDAPWTAVHDTPNKSLRQNVARRGVVLHHAAMTSLSGLRDMEVYGTKQVSSTAICKDGNLELVVSDDRYRPWSLSSAYWDSAMRSVETCNESTNGWTISDASHWSLARAVAYWSTTDGFWPHRDGDPGSWTVIGHREVYSIHGASYATACPGGLDLGLVTRRAQAILNGSAPAGGGYTSVEDDMTPEQSRKLDAVYAGMFGPASLGIPQMTWARPFGEKPAVAYYGSLDVAIHSQTLIAGVQAQVKALADVVAAGGEPVDIDLDAIRQAAEAGAASARLSAEDLAQLAGLVAADVVAQLPDDTDVDAGVIAEAVRAKFRTEPLT